MDELIGEGFEAADVAVPELPPAVPDKAVLAAQREQMLRHWEKTTNKKRTHLYSRKDAVIKKSSYHRWLDGETSSKNKTVERLEKYLKKP